MEQTNRIPLDDADLATLKHFAELALGIEIKDGTNSSQIRAKIKKAMPDLKDVPPIPAPPAPVVQQVAQASGDEEAPIVYNELGEAPSVRPAAISRPATAALLHQVNDPRVEITIAKTAEKHRSKDVTVAVNGVTCRMKRGERINVPYRVYEALKNAIEKIQVETDEINPATGSPYYTYEEVQSYPFTVHRMPSDDEIAAWHKKTDEGFQPATRASTASRVAA